MKNPLLLTTRIRLLCIVLPMVSCLASSDCIAQGCPASPPVSPPWLTFPAQPFHHEAATPFGPQSAHVYVMDLGGELGRPFVFVEGIDFGLSNEEGPHRLGDFGWQAFQGCDLQRYPMLQAMPDLLDSLIDRGYHPVLIDFHQGAGNILRNAALLVDILIHLREYRSDPRPMVVSGASMGGQVARIALAQMEAQGEPHCAQVYLSLDSPHSGANVPLGLQQLIASLTTGDAGLNGLAEALMAPAARQLLLEHQTPGSTRPFYQQYLDSIGWPQHCRNVAIANGGLQSLGSADTPLLDYEYALLPSDVFGDIGGLLDLEIHAFPGDFNHASAAPLAPVTSWAETPQGSGWPWPLLLDAGFGIPSSQYGPWSLDLMPGGTRPSLQQFADAFNVALEDIDLPWPLTMPPLGSDQFQTHHSFIPTHSALGIALPWTASMLNDLENFSPFNAIHTGNGNEPHSEINVENSAFVMTQLDLTECPLSPGALTGESVLNDHGDWNLPALDITGRLSLQSSDTAFGIQAAPPSSVGHFTLEGCSGTLHVAASGHLELGGGAAPTTSIAHLTLAQGSRLEILGKLTLHENSQLTIEQGAELVLTQGTLDQRPGSHVAAQPGSVIQVDGAVTWIQSTGSTFLLNGHCSVQAGAEWTHHHSPASRIHVPGSTSLIMGTGAQMVQKALTAETHWILSNQAEIHISGYGKWRHEKVGIRMMGNSIWHSQLTEPLEFESAQWWGMEGDSLLVMGPLHLRHHHAHAVHLGHENGTYRLQESTFSGGTTTVSNNRIRWSDSSFLDHPVEHHGLESSPSHLIESCHFESAPTAILLQGPGRIRIEDSRFPNNGVALSSRHARVEIQCCTWNSNDVGISTDRGLLVMCPEGGGGWNTFENNDVHMTFQQAAPPAIQDGANHFGNFYSGWAWGSLDIPCAGSPINWDISGQSWNWPSGWQQIQGGLWAMGGSGAENCPISAVDLMPIEAQACREGDKKEE